MFTNFNYYIRDTKCFLHFLNYIFFTNFITALSSINPYHTCLFTLSSLLYVFCNFQPLASQVLPLDDPSYLSFFVAWIVQFEPHSSLVTANTESHYSRLTIGNTKSINSSLQYNDNYTLLVHYKI